nr:MAG TPA: hypothetical protein [Caudoviricetes sp.]
MCNLLFILIIFDNYYFSFYGLKYLVCVFLVIDSPFEIKRIYF